MDKYLYTLPSNDLTSLALENTELARSSLEEGKVLYLPNYSFSLKTPTETTLLSETILDAKHKNVSFNYMSQRLGGFNSAKFDKISQPILHAFMQRYAHFAKQLVDTLLPSYQHALTWGRTSYRPAEINGRPSSKRKDDTRLHVDSFSATPVNGLRILRVFTNINPYNEPRIWHLGEPFNTVFERFSSHAPRYHPFKAKLLHWIKATKTLRSAYDHYQLYLHDQMKLDDRYQNTVPKFRIEFPAHSSWIVFTDHVSHAALSGQFLLEQTFYLPVSAMADQTLAPLSYWMKKTVKYSSVVV